MAKVRKSGKPKALEVVREDDDKPMLTPEEFIQEFFPPVTSVTGEEIATGSNEPQTGLPSIDWLKEKFKTKSAAIRYLFNLGPSIGFLDGTPPKIIAKHLGIRPQHARNVCKTPLKRGPNEDWRVLPKTPGDPKGDPTQ